MTLDDIDITDNLVWQDEFQHNQVQQAVERSLTGGLLVQEGARHYGRPITLGPSWLPRATVDALRAKEAQASHVMTLTLADGRQYSVIFNRSKGPAVDASMVNPYTNASTDPGWQYTTTVRLLTVEPPA